jgi:hypothetical protein
MSLTTPTTPWVGLKPLKRNIWKWLNDCLFPIYTPEQLTCFNSSNVTLTYKLHLFCRLVLVYNQNETIIFNFQKFLLLISQPFSHFMQQEELGSISRMTNFQINFVILKLTAKWITFNCTQLMNLTCIQANNAATCIFSISPWGHSNIKSWLLITKDNTVNSHFTNDINLQIF